MLWQGRRESENVEGRARSGGGGRIVLGGESHCHSVVLISCSAAIRRRCSNSQQAQLPQSAQFDNQAPRDEASKFVGVVLADTEDAWNESFRQMADGTRSEALLFTDLIQSGCGFASGPTVRSNLSTNRRVTSTSVFSVNSRTPGCRRRFAEAYVIAHEVDITCRNLLVLASCAGGARSMSQSDTISSCRGSAAGRFSAGVGPLYRPGQHVVEAGISKSGCAPASAVATIDFNQFARYVVPIHLRTARPNNVGRWFRRLRDRRSQPGRYV